LYYSDLFGVASHLGIAMFVDLNGTPHYNNKPKTYTLKTATW
jgi:hypothetical protein